MFIQPAIQNTFSGTSLNNRSAMRVTKFSSQITATKPDSVQFSGQADLQDEATRVFALPDLQESCSRYRRLDRRGFIGHGGNR